MQTLIVDRVAKLKLLLLSAMDERRDAVVEELYKWNKCSVVSSSEQITVFTSIHAGANMGPLYGF